MSAVSTARKTNPKDQSLSRKVPENPRYKNVKSVLDTGATAKKGPTINSRIKELPKKYDEVFKRIKLSTFISLMVEVAKEELQGAMFAAKPPPTPLPQEQTQHKSSLHRVISGFGELDSKLNTEETSSQPIEQATSTAPYLLLDVRDTDSYERYHMITAKSYPSSMLCRTCNYETKDLLTYKNVPLQIIVVYDEDETIAPRVAATLTQRGYDNIFLLSGGLRLAANKIPMGLTLGQMPTHFRPTTGLRKAKECSGDGLDFKLRRRMAENKFTMEDLEILENQLDGFVANNSRSKYCESRVSTAKSTMMSTAKSTMTSVSRATTARSRAWR